MRTTLMLLVATVLATPWANAQTRYSYKGDPVTIVPLEGGQVLAYTVVSPSGQKAAFLHGAFNSTALVAVWDIDNGSNTLSSTVNVRSRGELTWSANDQWILFGDLKNATSEFNDLQVISKVNQENSLEEDVLTPGMLGLDSNHSLSFPEIYSRSDGTSELVVLVYDFNQPPGSRVVGKWGILVDETGNPIDADENGLADDVRVVTSNFSLFEGMRISADLAVAERPVSSNSRELYLLSGVETGATISSFGSRAIKLDGSEARYIFGLTLLNGVACWGEDQNGSFDVNSNFTFENPVNYDTVWVDVEAAMSGSVERFVLETSSIDEAGPARNPLDTTVIISNTSGLQLATVVAARDLSISGGLVQEDFTMRDSAGVTIQLTAGQVAESLASLVEISTSSTDAPDASLELALQGEVLLNREISFSADVDTTLRLTIVYPQARVANLGDENDLMLAVSDPAITAELVSLDVDNNIIIVDLTGGFSGPAKSGGPLAIGLGVLAPPPPVWEGWPTGAKLPAAGSTGLGLLVGVIVATGVILQWRRKQQL